MTTNLTAPDIAEIVGLTPRRIRQWAEDGQLKRQGVGLYDVGWCMYLAIANKAAPQQIKKHGASVMVAWSWLSGVANPPTPADRTALVGLFKRNGFTADDAAQAIGTALALI
ncbi:helix-turn-helix domain-containing protein [Comamonas sp. Y33R10-2]|uniref:helix-turn-helix domain-containing protein n=1 Tax=Comamonas sp. Y33R10-2 TaxID=2853257 RepID=UPI001C5CBFFA|nr:helix-turn-helix domain-containing protein [Comamonas sp. Y33R10-2]QXZ10777.1 helix-turn-helix domain-containing protein [Comamonas sp. Y33R10-2]